MATLLSVPSKNFIQKTLDAQLLAGATASATLNNTTSIQNLPGVFIVDRVDTQDVETPNKREVIKYTGVSGATVTGLTRNADSSGTDQDHAVGAIVEFVPDVLWAQSFYDVLTTEHTTTGTHDASVLAKLAGNQTFTGVKTFTAGLLKVVDLLVGSATLSLPSTADTLVGRATTDTLTNKTLTTPIIDARKGTITADTDGGTVTFDMNTSDKHSVILGGNRTLAVSNVGVGQVFIIKLIQDGTGSRTVTWFSTIKWAGGAAPTLTTTLNKADTFGFLCTSSGNYDGFIIGQNI